MWAMPVARFTLDHFLSCTYVCHDALRNLVPTPAVNGAKSNQHPDHIYTGRLIDFHFQAHKAARRALSERAWWTLLANYVSGLRISESELLNHERLAEAYSRLVLPQLETARGVGFKPNWRGQPLLNYLLAGPSCRFGDRSHASEIHTSFSPERRSDHM
jgi:hypothetical protein